MIEDPSIVESMEIPDGRIRVRTTLVVRREADRWKVVHAHYSVGIADERAAELSPA